MPAFDGKPRKSAIIRGIRALLGFLNCENNDVVEEEEIFIPCVSVGGFRLRDGTRDEGELLCAGDFFERGRGEFEEDPVSRGEKPGD